MCVQFQKIMAQVRRKKCLPNKESVTGHRCERKNMAAKFKIYMNFNTNFIGICQKQI